MVVRIVKIIANNNINSRIIIRTGTIIIISNNIKTIIETVAIIEMEARVEMEARIETAVTMVVAGPIIIVADDDDKPVKTRQ